MIKKQYQFGDTIVEVKIPEEMKIPECMSLFEVQVEEASVEKVCELEFADDLAIPVAEFCSKYPNMRQIARKNMNLLIAPEKECRILKFEGAQMPYAVYVEGDDRCNHTWISHDVQELLDLETVFVSLLGLEKIMIQKGALILHCAYMCKDGRAVLFSAPSETGKSTQAKLWERYRGTRTVNGDKSLLTRKEDGWYANGWPICGSSEICHNEAYPIQAIVMLHQAKENEVQRLGIAEAMKKLMSQITINMWNAQFQIQAMDLIQQLVMEVPVFELGCNISEDAVGCLERVL